MYTNNIHIYCVTNLCGAASLQANVIGAPMNIILRSKTVSNDKKETDNDYFMNLYTKNHQ